MSKATIDFMMWFGLKCGEGRLSLAAPCLVCGGRETDGVVDRRAIRGGERNRHYHGVRNVAVIRAGRRDRGGGAIHDGYARNLPGVRRIDAIVNSRERVLGASAIGLPALDADRPRDDHTVCSRPA